VACQRLLCAISGNVDWWVGSPARDSWKKGYAEYQIEVTFNNTGQRLIRFEASTVTYREGVEVNSDQSRRAIQDRLAP
jgi:hypothetical protein